MALHPKKETKRKHQKVISARAAAFFLWCYCLVRTLNEYAVKAEPRFDLQRGQNFEYNRLLTKASSIEHGA